MSTSPSVCGGRGSFLGRAAFVVAAGASALHGQILDPEACRGESVEVIIDGSCGAVSPYSAVELRVRVRNQGMESALLSLDGLVGESASGADWKLEFQKLASSDAAVEGDNGGWAAAGAYALVSRRACPSATVSIGKIDMPATEPVSRAAVLDWEMRVSDGERTIALAPGGELVLVVPVGLVDDGESENQGAEISEVDLDGLSAKFWFSGDSVAVRARVVGSTLGGSVLVSEWVQWNVGDWSPSDEALKAIAELHALDELRLLFGAGDCSGIVPSYGDAQLQRYAHVAACFDGCGYWRDVFELTELQSRAARIRGEAGILANAEWLEALTAEEREGLRSPGELIQACRAMSSEISGGLAVVAAVQSERVEILAESIARSLSMLSE